MRSYVVCGHHLRLLGWMHAPARDPARQLVEIEIDDRRGEQRQRLADDEAADHGITERLPDLRAGPRAKHEWHAAEHRRHGGHHDRPEAQKCGATDGVMRRQMIVSLGCDGEVDEHDAVLLHDADEQDDADERDQTEIEMEQHQCRKRAHAGRRQSREDRQRMDVAFIKNAEDKIDDHQRRNDQQRYRRKRLLESLRIALKARGYGAGQLQILLGARSTASVAWPSATPGARLKLMVIAGNWP